METIDNTTPFRRFLIKLAFRFHYLIPLRNLLMFGRLNPNSRAYWNRQWAKNPQGIEEVEGSEALMVRIISKLKPGETILDLGCGSGLLLERIKNAIPDIARLAGQDLSPQAVRNLEQKGIECRAGKLPDIAYSAGEFHTFIITQTLEHLSNPAKTIQAVARAGGKKLLASVPNYMPPHNTLEHVNHWTEKTFPAFLADNLPGWRLVTTELVEEKANLPGQGHVLVHLQTN